MQPAMPCGLRLSLHSPHPTRPSSVSTRTNVHGRQPPSQCRVSTFAIFIASPRARHGECQQPAKSERAAPWRPLCCQGEVGEAPEQLPEHDLAFEPRQWRPQAEVNAGAKRRVPVIAATYVEAVG